MGRGADRNRLCPCESGKKIKQCKCKISRINELFPDGTLLKSPQGMFKVLGIVTENDYPGLEELDGERSWYAPLCSLQQIDRIFKPENGKDILLKKQVESILDNMRINRTFYKKYNMIADWNIEKQFDHSVFYLLQAALKDTDFFEEFRKIPCGMTYDSDANGQCMKTQYGNIIMISAVLKDFLYYMNIFYYGIKERNIPEDVIFHAQRIAIRIMIQTEALDFELDPRGKVPELIEEEIVYVTSLEVLFVAAHEFSHSILGHLDDNNVIRCNCHNGTSTIFNQSQKQELEADIQAIHLMSTVEGYDNAIGAAMYFFLALDLFEQAKEQIFPSISSYKTHPGAVERIENIRAAFEESKQYNMELMVKRNEVIKQALMEDISIHMEEYESYGSVYLGSWHKKMLRDRIDY